MDRNGIVYPKWPAQSPVLNPIEMVWPQMKHYVNNVHPRNQEHFVEYGVRKGSKAPVPVHW